MTGARIAVCVLLASCSRADNGPRRSDAPGATSPAKPSPDAKDVAVCHADSECAVRGLPDPSETEGGPCCPGCGLYEAAPASQAHESPECDWQRRGICSRSCTPESAAPPAAKCVGGRCALGYPAIDDTCAFDTDCASLPEILPASAGEPCHLACGQAIATSRTSAEWLEGLWLNPTVAGTCPADCVGQPRPSGKCLAGHCTIASLKTVRVVRAEVRSAYVDAARHVPEVEAIANRNADELRRCRERPRNVGVTDSWTLGLDFVIGADGGVTSETPNGLATALPDIAQCIDGLVRQWRFPPPDSKAPWHINANLTVFLE